MGGASIVDDGCCEKELLGHLKTIVAYLEGNCEAVYGLYPSYFEFIEIETGKYRVRGRWQK